MKIRLSCLFLHFLTVFIVIFVWYGNLAAFSNRPKIESSSVSDEMADTIYFTVDKVAHPFDLSLSLINTLPDSQQKSDWIITTFVAHIQKGGLAQTKPYLKELKSVFPALFLRAFSTIVLELDRYGYSLEKITQFIHQTGSKADQQYAFEQWVLYLVEQGRILQARQQISHIQNEGVRIRIYGKLAIYYATKNERSQLDFFLEKIPFQNEKDVVYYEIALVNTRLNPTAPVIEMVQGIRSLSLRQRAQREVSIALAKNQSFDEAVKLLNLIEDVAVYAHTLAQLSMVYADHQKFESAYQLIKSINNDFYTNMATGHLAKRLSEINDIDQAKLLLENITIASFREEVLIEISKNLARMKQNEAALQFADQIQSTEKREDLLVSVSRLFGKQDSYHYQALLIKQFEPEPLYQRAWLAFIESYALSHSLDRSYVLINDLSDKRKYDVLLKVVSHFANKGDLSTVTKVISSLKTIDLKVPLLTESVSLLPLAQIGITDIQILIEWLYDLDKKISIRGEEINDHIRIDLALALLYNRLGNDEMTLSTLTNLSKNIAFIQDSEFSDLVLNRMIMITADHGYFKLAYSHIFDLTNIEDQLALLNGMPLPTSEQLKGALRYLREE